MLQIFKRLLSNNAELSEEKISELVDAFMNAIPVAIVSRFKKA